MDRAKPDVLRTAEAWLAEHDRLPGNPRYARLRAAPLVEPAPRDRRAFLVTVLWEVPAFLALLAFVGGLLFLLVGVMG